MKNWLFTVSLIASLLPISAQADIDIKLGKGIQLLAHNGKEVSQGGLTSAAAPLRFNNGEQQILVRYNVDLSRNRDEAELESSDTFLLRFSATDQQIRVAVPEIRTRQQFYSFNRSGGWQLSSAGQPIEFEQARLKTSGFQLVRNYEQEIFEFNQSGHPASLKTTATAVHKSINNSGVSAKSNGNPLLENPEQTAEAMLKYWYLNADPTTRARFKAWLETQQ